MNDADAMPSTAVKFCGVTLDNPLMLGSGGLGESAESLEPFQAVAGAVAIRTVRMNVQTSRRSFPSPHLALGPRHSWLLNCEWGNQRSIRYWIERELSVASSRGPVLVSVSGRNIDDCVRSCSLLDAQAQFFEINISCSHAGVAYGRLTDDLDHIRDLMRSLRDAISSPIVVKLGWSPVLPEAAVVAADYGAAAISVTNSIGPGLDIDVKTGRPRLGISGGFGGLSGPAIFPIALECVREVVDSVNIPVIGVGGVRSYVDVVKMLMVGATCVQLYTSAFLRGPRLFSKITADLRRYMFSMGYSKLGEIQGLALPHLRAESNLLPLVPVIDSNRCTPCGQCARICPHDAISIREVANIDPGLCTGCGICVDVCPPAFDAISLPSSGILSE
jgi:dihydroorotate dehydrogenase (NAD+) catalytic subunit